jgi:hypothetical protein
MIVGDENTENACDEDTDHLQHSGVAVAADA